MKAFVSSCSPEVLLASVFSKREERSLFLLTGESGVGKTRYCLELFEQARAKNIPVYGLVSPPVFHGSTKVGIDLLDLVSGESRRLAVLRRWCVKPVDQGPQTEDWQFDVNTLIWGNQVLEVQSNPLKERPGLLIIDEFGPLELLRNEGLQSGLRLVDEQCYTLACVVVRPALLTLAQKRWPWGQALTLLSPNRLWRDDQI